VADTVNAAIQYAVFSNILLHSAIKVKVLNNSAMTVTLHDSGPVNVN